MTKKPLVGIPLIATMDNESDISNSAITDENGVAVFHIFRLSDKTPNQRLLISRDYATLCPDAVNTDLLNDANPIVVEVMANSPLIFIDISETIDGNKTQNPYIMPAIKELFVAGYEAEFTDNKSLSNFAVTADANVIRRSKKANENFRHPHVQLAALPVRNLQYHAVFPKYNQPGAKSAHKHR